MPVRETFLFAPQALAAYGAAYAAARGSAGYDLRPVQEALDALGLALTDHGHQWTGNERSLYDKATRILKNWSGKSTCK